MPITSIENILTFLDAQMARIDERIELAKEEGDLIRQNALTNRWCAFAETKLFILKGELPHP